ncbi:hypothetical protein V3415_01980 [Pseudomonas aeruginosa]|uniref:hypothetical protein n=1 Tax=Pseudomonas aeruginosa TaxID=287 RepID=UPI002F419A7A
MKVVRRYPLALLLGMAGALADELPDGSLLQRYGVQADQLPTLAADPPSRKEEKETPSRFRVEPEQPLVTFGVKDHKGMEPTGNRRSTPCTSAIGGSAGTSGGRHWRKARHSPSTATSSVHEAGARVRAPVGLRQRCSRRRTATSGWSLNRPSMPASR